jgi:hypothetical protein
LIDCALPAGAELGNNTIMKERLPDHKEARDDGDARTSN